MVETGILGLIYTGKCCPMERALAEIFSASWKYLHQPLDWSRGGIEGGALLIDNINQQS